MRTIDKPFFVIAKSSNTNSFGLYQMILVSRDGEVYKTHASMYNAKEVGVQINQRIVVDSNNRVKHSYFIGHEMTEQLEQAPKKVLNEFFGEVVDN